MISKLVIPLMLMAAIPGFAQSGAASPKELFYEAVSAPRPAIKFNVQLDRNGDRKIVPTTYTFQSGDKMKFRFELNRDCYVYVLLHSITGDPAAADRYAGTRGIEIIRVEDRRARLEDSYQLLFPTVESGMNNQVVGHTVKTMPYADAKYFRMDRNPGMEKLFLVASAQPLDFSPYFDMHTGRMRSAAIAAAKDRAVPDENALDQLTRSLLGYGANAQVASAKGIDIVDGYAAAVSASNPMLVTVDLRHLPAR